MRPFHDLMDVERFLEDGTGIELEPGPHMVRFGVTAHDGDPAGELWMAVNEAR